eukprot:5014965-Prymnesium_polylepis.1
MPARTDVRQCVCALPLAPPASALRCRVSRCTCGERVCEVNIRWRERAYVSASPNTQHPPTPPKHHPSQLYVRRRVRRGAPAAAIRRRRPRALGLHRALDIRRAEIGHPRRAAARQVTAVGSPRDVALAPVARLPVRGGGVALAQEQLAQVARPRVA